MLEEKLYEYCHEYFNYNKILGGLWYKKVPRGIGKNWINKQAGSLHPLGYRAIKIKGKIYREHHLVFLFHKGKLPLDEIDHVNRVYFDNRIENLREATRTTNCRNRKGWGTHSKYKGVVRSKRGRPWTTTISINSKTYHLGTFNCEIEAAKAYDIAAIKNDPEFTNTNFPKENYELST